MRSRPTRTGLSSRPQTSSRKGEPFPLRLGGACVNSEDLYISQGLGVRLGARPVAGSAVGLFMFDIDDRLTRYIQPKIQHRKIELRSRGVTRKTKRHRAIHAKSLLYVSSTSFRLRSHTRSDLSPPSPPSSMLPLASCMMPAHSRPQLELGRWHPLPRPR